MIGEVMKKKGIILITIVCILVGFLIVTAFSKEKEHNLSSSISSLAKIENLVEEKNQLIKDKEVLLEKIGEYERTLNDYEQQAAKKSTSGRRITKELKDARLLAGLTDVKGPGIEVVLNDKQKDTFTPSDNFDPSMYIVHDIDLLDVINELKSAGAEAISVNNERILPNSRITCGGPIINVGKDKRFAPPFIINAIGDSQEMQKYLMRSDGIINILKFFGLSIKVSVKDEIIVPRYYGEIMFNHAKSIEDGE